MPTNTDTAFRKGDLVTPTTQLQGIPFPEGVVGVVVEVHKNCEQITVEVRHDKLYPDGTNKDFPPEYLHRFTVYRDRLRIATTAAT